ncbi:hypothetical protein PGT21_008277 [Puccinia graminis f. sp. tritici]|uniref:Uncharacterized protein n=1 Tax=Puccinia graminis f. sp. tritici TaxID=56615 RepID=A0A5B0R0N0_PUCGR|nr:hypothetical protein PGT21_008277 [Puccinia graminis f. sp. tritici]
MPVEKFIKRYENAGLADDASAQDLARQIISFIHGMDLKDEVEEMTGHEDSDWELLKAQLLNRFGSSLPLVKYSRQDLKKLVNNAIQAGGIKTLEEFKNFRTKFESVTTYLFRMGYSNSLEEFRELLLESLSPDLEASVTRELIRDNKMLSSMDGGDILPDTQIILAYIHREVQSTSVMERRKLHRMEPMEPTKELDNSTSAIKNPSLAPKPSTPACSNELEQKFEELTRKFEAYYVKINPTHPSGPAPSQSSSPAPRKSEFKCYYCFLKGHGTRKCNSVLYDESIGAVARDGKLFKLPDSTTIPWDTSRPIKQVVDQYSRNSVQLFSSFGQLVEISPEELRAHKEDLAKRNISAWKKKETSATENWTTQEKENPMETGKSDLRKMANLTLSSSSPELSSSSNFTTLHPSTSQGMENCQYSEIQHLQFLPTEEPPRKYSLHTSLATEDPGSGKEMNHKLSVINQGNFLSYGGTLTLEHEFSEDLKKFPNRTLPLEDKISENLGKSEDEDKQNSVARLFGRLGLTLDGLGQHDLLDTGSIFGEINLLRNLSTTLKNSDEIQESAAGLDIGNQLGLISVSLTSHQKCRVASPFRIPTLGQTWLFKFSQLFLSSQLMGALAKLGEGFTTKTLEFKHFCQQTASNFMYLHGNESVLQSGALSQDVDAESFQKLSSVLKEVAIEVLVSKLLDQYRTGRLFFYFLDFIAWAHPIGITDNFARRCWVDQAFGKVAKGWRMSSVTALQGRAYSGNPSLSEVVRGSQTASSSALQERTVRFLPIAVRNKCQKGKYNVKTPVVKSSNIEAINVVRKQAYSLNQEQDHVAICKGWKTYSLEEFSTRNCFVELIRKIKNKRSESEGVASEATQRTMMRSGSNNSTSRFGVAWFLSRYNLIFISSSFFILGSLSSQAVCTLSVTLSLKHWQAITKRRENCLKVIGIDDGINREPLKALFHYLNTDPRTFVQLDFVLQWNCVAPHYCCTNYGRQAISSNPIHLARKAQTQLFRLATYKSIKSN